MVRAGTIPRRLLPGPAARYWWADMSLWRELWDAVITRNPVATVAEGPSAADRRAETPPRGSWADPAGLGRCPRCRAWLTGPSQVRWACRFRAEALWFATFLLCGDCTQAVLAAWEVPTGEIRPMLEAESPDEG